MFHFYATSFILRFLLRTFFKTVGEPMYLLSVHPKLIFRGALKNALVVLESWKINIIKDNALQKSSLAD